MSTDKSTLSLPTMLRDIWRSDPDANIDPSLAMRPRFELENGAHKYNAAACYLSALASAWSYSNVATLKDLLTDAMQMPLECACFEAHNASMYLDTDAYLLYTKDTRSRFGILVFRGTELTSVGDILADLNVDLVPFPDRSDTKGNVHTGFHEGVGAIWKRVYAMLDKAGIDELVITGHSLGGALALLVTARLFLNDDDAVLARVQRALRGVYTFGQPAVGDARFCSWLRERAKGQIFRHVYARDVVPRVPTVDMGCDFRHLPLGIWTTNAHGEFWEGPSEQTTFHLARFFAMAAGMSMAEFVTRRINVGLSRKMLRFWYSLDDHSPVNYLRISKQTYLNRSSRSTLAPSGKDQLLKRPNSHEALAPARETP
jgi:pimeloyl-ACP methyl ester carboxylesterase